VNIFLRERHRCFIIRHSLDAFASNFSLVGKLTNFFPDRCFEPPTGAVRAPGQTIFEISLLFS